MPSKTHQAPSLSVSSDILSELSELLAFTIKDSSVIPKITRRIAKWTGNEPELTQIIGDYITDHAAQFNQVSDEAKIQALVDRIVETNIIKRWQQSHAASHFRAIVSTLVESDRKDLVLLSYLKILQRGSVAANNSLEQAILLRSGLITQVDEHLTIANPLYAEVFDLSWIEQQLPGITRPVTIIGPAGKPQKKQQPNRRRNQRPPSQKPPSQNTSERLPERAQENTPADLRNRDVLAQQPSQGNIMAPRSLASLPESRKPSAASGFYSKLSVVICCCAVVGAVVSAYRYETTNRTSAQVSSQASPQASANSAGSFQAASANDLIQPADAPAQSEPQPDTASDSTEPNIPANAAAPDPATTDRLFFDKGVEHATNSRWLLMVREFCQIPQESTYYATAASQLKNWVTLYRDDIQIAQETFLQEESEACPMVSEALRQ